MHGCGRCISFNQLVSFLKQRFQQVPQSLVWCWLGIHQTLSPHCIHDIGTNPRGLDGGCQLSYSCKVQLQWNGCMWGNMTWKQPSQDCHFLRIQMSHGQKTQLIGKNFPPIGTRRPYRPFCRRRDAAKPSDRQPQAQPWHWFPRNGLLLASV